MAEMVRYAVGYQSRAFVTFGAPIPLSGYDPESRRDVMALGHQIRDTIGRLYKVLPTAVVAAAMRPSITRRELEARADAIIETCAAPAPTWASRPAARRSKQGAEPLADRNIIHVERGGRFRVRERTVLRYYARTLQHLLAGPQASPGPTDDRSRFEGLFHMLAGSQTLKHLASRYGMRTPGSFARRFIAGETVEEAIAAARAHRGRRPDADARLSRRERRDDGRGRRRRRAPTSAIIDGSPRPGSGATSR